MKFNKRANSLICSVCCLIKSIVTDLKRPFLHPGIFICSLFLDSDLKLPGNFRCPNPVLLYGFLSMLLLSNHISASNVTSTNSSKLSSV